MVGYLHGALHGVRYQGLNGEAELYLKLSGLGLGGVPGPIHPANQGLASPLWVLGRRAGVLHTHLPAGLPRLPSLPSQAPRNSTHGSIRTARARCANGVWMASDALP